VELVSNGQFWLSDMPEVGTRGHRGGGGAALREGVQGQAWAGFGEAES